MSVTNGVGFFDVLAGDFKEKSQATVFRGRIDLKVPGRWRREKIQGAEVEHLEVATEESVKKLGGTAAWGAAGALLLGPAGLIAGAILGGRGKKVTFTMRFRDGRKLLGQTDARCFEMLQAACF